MDLFMIVFPQADNCGRATMQAETACHSQIFDEAGRQPLAVTRSLRLSKSLCRFSILTLSVVTKRSPIFIGRGVRLPNE
jgi:hypothetical protein